MAEYLNLFGEWEKETGKMKPKVNGYAWTPGTGPEDKKCKHCKHFYKHELAGTYFKCDLTEWTNGPATDIRANSPACKFFK